VSLFDRGRRKDGKEEPEPFEAPAPREAPVARDPVAGAAVERSRPVANPPILSKPSHATAVAGGGDMANIGKSITLKGDLSGNEDLVIEGHIEGRVDLPNNQLTIGANGSCSAEVHAKTVVVVGKVTGNVSATERIEIQATGLVNGDVSAPRLVVAEGAVVNGSIEMGTKKAGVATPPSSSPAIALSGEKKALP
jgi:cytoskeletal protein CcmA (bactofilin family)